MKITAYTDCLVVDTKPVGITFDWTNVFPALGLYLSHECLSIGLLGLEIRIVWGWRNEQ